MPDSAPSSDSPAALRVSVALGTHNGVAFLEAQLESIVRQSRPVDEIVISDDASTDGTLELVERLLGDRSGDDPKASPPSVILLRNPAPLGVTANFEQALRSTTGDLIALADQDDVWHVDRIARAVAVFSAEPGVDLVASDARLVDGAGHDLGATLFETLGVTGVLRQRLRSNDAFDELLRRNVMTGATMMVTSELVDRASPFPASWVHDEWLAIVASVGGGIGLVDGPLIDYRQHGGNQIGVRRLSIGGRFGRLRESRAARNARLLARADDLASRLPPLADDHVRVGDAVASKLSHERVRSALPGPRLRRLGPVWRQWRAGAYRHYGLGLQDVLRDLVQPR